MGKRPNKKKAGEGDIGSATTASPALSEGPQSPAEADDYDAPVGEVQDPVAPRPPTPGPEQISAARPAGADVANTDANDAVGADGSEQRALDAGHLGLLKGDPAPESDAPFSTNLPSSNPLSIDTPESFAGFEGFAGDSPGAVARDLSTIIAPQPSTVPELFAAEAQAFATDDSHPAPAVTPSLAALDSSEATPIAPGGESDPIPMDANALHDGETMTAIGAQQGPEAIVPETSAETVPKFDGELEEFAQQVILPSPLFSLVSDRDGAVAVPVMVPDDVREEAKAFEHFNGFAAQTTSLTPVLDVFGVAPQLDAQNVETDHFGDAEKLTAAALSESLVTSGSESQFPQEAQSGGAREADMDDFDDFVAPATDLAPAVSLSFLPPPSEVVAPSQADDFYDDFDDFQSPATGAAPLAVPSAIPEPPPAASDAGDFGDFEEFVAPVEVPTTAVLAPAAIPISTAAVHSFFEEAESREDDGGKVLELSAAFQGQSWSLLWQKMSAETFYSDTAGTQFRWRKSHIRTAYLLGLDINIRNQDETQKQPVVPLQRDESHATFGQLSPSTPRFATDGAGIQPSSAAIPESGKRDSRDAELLEAKRLCEVNEDELRNQTPEQLAALIASLTAAHQKMQDQANFWLDSKEQLVMDAEMHNKMIASLVQYAQQTTQKASSSARSSSPGKKGRR
ncbi:hypothetical protein HDU89_007912 [Geranomyces variabilis]|nr:hypothetical protein HDU89_007912 [Geranomyces variabilis]